MLPLSDDSFIRWESCSSGRAAWVVGTIDRLATEGVMPQDDGFSTEQVPPGAQVAEEIVRRAPDDLVFCLLYTSPSPRD